MEWPTTNFFKARGIEKAIGNSCLLLSRVGRGIMLFNVKVVIRPRKVHTPAELMAHTLCVVYRLCFTYW